jgi:hypothetical protein
MLFLIVGLLVCCVVMQIVGIRASLWDSSHIADNSVGSSVNSASALVAEGGDVGISSTVQFGPMFFPILYHRMFEYFFDHPPNLLVPRFVLT